MGSIGMVCGFTIETRYREETLETAYRSGSIEVNHYSGDYLALRAYRDSGVCVVSSVYSDSTRLSELLAKTCKPTGGESSSIYCGDFYKGEYRVGRGGDPGDLIELSRIISEKLGEKGVSSEVIAIARHTVIDHSVKEYNVYAREDRWLYELHVHGYALYMGNLLSTGVSLASINLKTLFDEVDGVVERIWMSIREQARSRRFNPLYIGSWKVLLAGDAACAFFHEITHLLEADEPLKLRLETDIGTGIKIVEDPFYPGPLQRLFDDELYPAWRRVLVDNGSVVDYLRSRLTSDSSRPGNGRGIFTRPKPMYYQLIVSSGDWSLEEVFEEVKKLVVVENIAKAELYRGYIRITPEHGYVYEKGTATPVKAFEILVPVAKLSQSLIGLTRRRTERFSYEKNQPIYEVAPSIILEARITT
ncbi:MAG: metallopeptidase TldD-related protein [Thermoprotei archaeon]